MVDSLLESSLLVRSPVDAPPIRTGPRGVTGWQEICRLNEVRPGRARPTLLNGIEITICRDDDDVYAISGRCPVRDEPLSDGTIHNGRIFCPLHGVDFDLRSGISPSYPQWWLNVYAARVVEGTIQLAAESVPEGPGFPDTYLGSWARHGAPDLAGMQALAEKRPSAVPTAMLEAQAVAGYPTVSGTPVGTEANDPTHLAEITFVPAQLTRAPLSATDPVATTVVIGANTDRPLTLAIPILVGHISLGDVSIEAKVALARGAREAGTAIGSGDGGLHGRERDAASTYILQLNPHAPLPESETLAEVSAVEIHLGSAGRPGLGHHLPANKVSTEIGLHREIPVGVDYHSPASRITATQLERLVAELRERGGGAPIGVKLAAGAIEDDLRIVTQAHCDFVTLDAHGAGSGGTPPHIRGQVGAPLLSSVIRARRALGAAGVSGTTLIVSGGLRTPDEMAKVLALGADAVSIGTAALVSIGCQQYQGCHTNACPVGIATQDPRLRLRLNPDISARRLATFLANATAAIADYCRVTGRSSVGELSSTDLIARSERAALITGLPYAG